MKSNLEFFFLICVGSILCIACEGERIKKYTETNLEDSVFEDSLNCQLDSIEIENDDSLYYIEEFINSKGEQVFKFIAPNEAGEPETVKFSDEM